MPQYMIDPNAGKSLQIWMAKTFENIGNPGGYTVIGPQSCRYNCIAHAIDRKDVRLTPKKMSDLIEIYARNGFYPLNDEPPQKSDAEVYSKDSEPRVPMHAYKIEPEVPGARPTKPEEMTCSSKMGEDFTIHHPRFLLQCTHKGSARYEHGIVRCRFRKDNARFAKQQGEYTTTKSGRKDKKVDMVLTNSMKRIRKADEDRTKSNRMTKKPRK